MALPFGKKKKAEAAAQSDAPKVKRHTEDHGQCAAGIRGGDDAGLFPE